MKNHSTLTNQEIANECQCSVSTVNYWWSRYQSNGNVLTKPRPGQVPALNATQEAEIIDQIEEDPFLTATYFGRKYDVSYMTIIRFLKKRGIHCRTAATQSRLTEEHKINRVAFCQNLLERWDENQLDSIVFSDEKTFSTDVKWRKKVYRPKNTRHETNYIKTDNLSGRINAAYWGAISFNGPATDIVRIDGRFNSAQYLQILNNHVLPIMTPNKIYMQDNSPVHTANAVMNFLANQTFDTMAWCPMSPDLNPIENVWSYITYDWPQMQQRTLNALDDVVQQRWAALRQNQSNIILFETFQIFILQTTSQAKFEFPFQIISTSYTDLYTEDLNEWSNWKETGANIKFNHYLKKSLLLCININ